MKPPHPTDRSTSRGTVTEQYRQENRGDKSSGNLEPLIISALTVVGMLVMSAITRLDRPPPPDVTSLQKQVRQALKDPRMTHAILDQLRDTQVIQEFVTDPDVLQNLRKLATAIESDVARHPANWSDKAVGNKAAQRNERK